MGCASKALSMNAAVGFIVNSVDHIWGMGGGGHVHGSK